MEIKFHLFILPKYRKKVRFDHLRKNLDELLREVPDLERANSRRAPKRRSQSYVDFNSTQIRRFSGCGHIKGKSAIHIARNYLGKRKNFTGQHFWARGYYVSTARLDEETIREYIRSHQTLDREMDQLSLFQ